MATTTNFLGIPVEIRLIIYELYLEEHQRVLQGKQPSNEHIVVLRTCKQISAEAGDLFRRYVSFKHSNQCSNFFHRATKHQVSQVLWVDAANDGRMAEDVDVDVKEPVSELYLALQDMKALKKLRVFPDHRPHSSFVGDVRVWWAFEEAMFPNRHPIPRLETYELYLGAYTKATPFERIPSAEIQRLRLSGLCWLEKAYSLPKLRHLILHTITGSFFDRIRLDDYFAVSRLQTFFYAQGDKMGFEIQALHLASLVPSPGSQLRKLVLLGCSKLKSTAIKACLENLPLLEYFALSFITVVELDGNFVLALPLSLSTLKLQILPARYSAPFFEEERDICNTLEASVLQRQPVPEAVHIRFRPELMVEDGREERWKAIADAAHFTLEIGPWEEEELARN